MKPGLIVWREDTPHSIGDLKCVECTYTPLMCRCGGIVHNEDDGNYEEDTVTFKKCDICGENFYEIY